jgi:hypothetical protein
MNDYSASKLKDLKPAKMWAAVSYDVPPEIWGVHFYREELQSNLRHIRVTVTPISKHVKGRKPKRKLTPRQIIMERARLAATWLV